MIQFIFEAVRSNGYLSDVAIDDITLDDGACSGNNMLLLHFVSHCQA